MPAPVTGQVTLASSPQQLASNQKVTAFMVKALASNAGQAFIGPVGVTPGTGFPLDPGETVVYERDDRQGSPIYELNPSDFWVVGSVIGDVVAWLVSP